MADNIKGIPFNSDDEGIDFPLMVKELVYQQALNLGVRKEHPTFSLDEVYIVWFAFTLGNCKALCSTSLPDGRYYEVTYRPAMIIENDKGQIAKLPAVAFVDTYKKTHNIAINIIKD